jgi:Pentapeptide repeats (8 copies)
MANPEHLEILNQGVKTWNRWRKDHSGVIPDLIGASLSGADLRKANLHNADLSKANLKGADLSGVDLSGAILDNANLSRANLGGVDLSEAKLRRAYLRETNFRDVRELTWEQLSEAIIDETTWLPPELEVRRMAEQGKIAAAPNYGKERDDKSLLQQLLWRDESRSATRRECISFVGGTSRRHC